MSEAEKIPAQEALESVKTRHGLNTEEIRRQIEENRARREKERPRILKQYGLKRANDFDLQMILEAELRMNLCALCEHDGRCLQREMPFVQPVMQVVDDNPFVSVAPCAGATYKKYYETMKSWYVKEEYFYQTLEDYKETPENCEAVAMAQWYVEEKPQRGLYLFGGCGTGKTFLAAILAQHFLFKNYKVAFKEVPTLIEVLKRSFDDNSGVYVQDELSKLKDADLLVLDDFGAGHVSEWSLGILYKLVNHFYCKRKRLCVTSNFSLEELEVRLKSKDKYSAQRIVSRLSEMCEVGYLGEKDWRRR